MGTRNLTAVVKDGKYVIAQYGQWDGYISYAGARILYFLQDKRNIEKLESRLKDCKFITEEEYNKILQEQCGVPENAFGLSMEQVEKRDKLLPFVSRDLGCDVLEKIIDTQGPVLLSNSIAFANNSLFCEYAYVIDLDKNTFEIYVGFNENPMDKTERFYSEEPNEDGYYPVRMVAEYNLNDLPDEESLENLELNELA